MNDLPKKDQLYELIRANPFISQQELADQLRLSRSAAVEIALSKLARSLKSSSRDIVSKSNIVLQLLFAP